MSELHIQRVDSLPATRQASTLYIAKGFGNNVDLFFTDSTNTNTYRLMNRDDVNNMLADITIPVSDTADKLHTPRHIAVSGDATWDVVFDGSANASAPLTLVASGIGSGEHTVYTVDAKGRATAARALTVSDIPGIGGEKLVSSITVNTTGNAATATKLATSRTINGVAFDGSANITINAVDSTARIAATEKGAVNGVATLDSGATIPTSQLPSYVDDVVEVATFAALPGTGESSKIYVILDVNKIYRWGGASYVQLTGGVALADSTAKLVNVRSIAMTGDGTWSVNFDGSANVSAAFTLSNSGVTAGTYSKPTVDAKGRVTVGANTSASEFNTALGLTTLNKAADTLTGTLNYADFGVMDVGVSTDLSLINSNLIRVTGTGDILSLGTLPDGAVRYLIIESASVTSIAWDQVTLIAPHANIIPEVGDVFVLKSLGSGSWKCVRYQKANNVLQYGTFNGSVYLKRGADIPSAATVNLDAATGDIVNITGTTTITAITLSDGAVKRVRFTGALTLTNSANLQLQANANMTTVAGDWAEFVGVGGGVTVMMQYSTMSGMPITANSTDSLSNKTFVEPIFTGVNENGVTVSGTAHTVNLTNGTDIDATTTNNFTFTMPSPSGMAGKSFTITVNYGGAHTVTFSGATIRWNTGVQPAPTSVNGKADRYTFQANRAGTAWMGMDGGRAF